LADERRRYLAQQMELGGAEVILEADRRAGGQAGSFDGATHAAPKPAPDPEQIVRPSAPPPDRPTSAQPKWKKGCPPIPGPGLYIEPPTPTLLGGAGLSELSTLDAIAERIRTTQCCGLCRGRTNAVPGEGNPAAQLMFIGEGPGATEDALGRPFVGQAGKLLDEIIQAIGLRREDVYITNIVKCRPPQNRKPLPDEMAACLPYLHRQIALIRPKVIVALGGTAGEALLNSRKSLGELRGKVHSYGGIPLVATYHPAALLRNPNWKKPTWDDVRIARQLLDR
jgi:uracil-DNA glycosylase family 4